MRAKTFLYLCISLVCSFGLLFLLFAVVRTQSEAADELQNINTDASSAEVLRWKAFADIPQGRGDPGLVTYDGKIYAISGFFSPGFNYVNNVAVYDPVDDSWELRWGVPNPRSDMAAATVGDNIYAIGGWISKTATVLSSTNVYHPNSDTWITKTSIITPVSGAGVAAFNDEIYIFGGFDGTDEVNSVQIYDTADDSWSAGTPMSLGRTELGAALLNGKIYVVGGQTFQGATSSITNSVDIYDPILDEWSSGTPLPEPLRSFAIAVNDDQIFIFGGKDSTNSIRDVTYIFDPQEDSWTTGWPMPTARWANRASAVGDSIHVIGGAGSPTAGAANEAYGPIQVVYTPLLQR